MAKMSIIKKCIEIIDYNCESDCEDGGAYYTLSYSDGKIQFTRTTSYYTGDYDDYGECTKSYSRTVCEWEADLVDYTNLAVVFASSDREHLKYEYGSEVECINFQQIL